MSPARSYRGSLHAGAVGADATEMRDHTARGRRHAGPSLSFPFLYRGRAPLLPQSPLRDAALPQPFPGSTGEESVGCGIRTVSPKLALRPGVSRAAWGQVARDSQGQG